MVYTSGLIKDMTKMETLEELQDNKMTMVCEKLGLQKGDRMLDIGCGWGTLATHAAKNYEADVTGGERWFDESGTKLLTSSSYSCSKSGCLWQPKTAGEWHPRVPRSYPLHGLSRCAS